MRFSVKAHHLPQRIATGAFTQTTQAQSTDGQGTEAQGTEDQSRREQARPHLKNADVDTVIVQIDLVDANA